MRIEIFNDNKFIEDDYAYSFHEIKLKVYFSGTRYSQKNQIKTNNNLLYACSPPDLESFETIRDIQVYCRQDYDSLHPIGTSLNDIIEIRSNSLGKSTIEEYLSKNPNIEDAEFFFLKAPDQSLQYEFEIQYTFDGLYTNQLNSVSRTIYIKE